MLAGLCTASTAFYVYVCPYAHAQDKRNGDQFIEKHYLKGQKLHREPLMMKTLNGLFSSSVLTLKFLTTSNLNAFNFSALLSVTSILCTKLNLLNSTVIDSDL